MFLNNLYLTRDTNHVTSNSPMFTYISSKVRIEKLQSSKNMGRWNRLRIDYWNMNINWHGITIYLWEKHNITLDTSSRVYIGFCTSWVATLNWVITEWQSHEWWPNNVATNDVQKPLYTSEEVSNAISILQSICINIKMLYNCIDFKKGIVIFAPLSLLYKLDTGKCHYVWTLTPSREQNFKWSLKLHQ